MRERRPRREFTPEFKLEAVRLATSGEKSLRQVAREIGVHENLLRSWKRQALERSGGGAGGAGGVGGPEIFPGNGKLTSQDEELRRLRRELAVTRQERDFLKKAAAFFAKESR
jgi:transposase